MSLRLKLALAGFAVQLLLAGLLIVSQINQADKKTQQEIELRAVESAPLLIAALLEPLIQRDYATLSQLLDETRRGGFFKYFILLDHRQRLIASTGRDPQKALAALDSLDNRQAWERPDHCIHLALDINHAGQMLGRLHYGISLAPVLAARQDLLKNGVFIALLGAAIGTLAFGLIGLGLTRGLRQLAQASAQVMGGNYQLQLSPRGSDELGQLAVAFNGMSAAVRQRVAELVDSHAKQAAYLLDAQSEHARLAALLNAMRFGVLMVDNAGRIVYTNPACHAIWGLSSATGLLGQPAESLLVNSPHYIASSAEQQGKCLLLPATSQGSSLSELCLADSILLEQTGQLVIDVQGAPLGCLWIFDDITGERQAQQLISRLAERDSLTGLLNRHTFSAILESLIRKGGSDVLTLLYLDLDSFKLVNDLNGHAMGDRLLLSVANALTATLRPGDLCARLGGDEFVILLKQFPGDQLSALCQRLLSNVTESSARVMQQAELPGRISCSIGVADFPQSADSAGALMAAADQAMYRAKAGGRNTWRRFVPDLQFMPEKSRWLIWEDRINEALEQQRFQIYLQGIFDTKTRQLVHYEALLRLPDANEPGAFFPPGEFIVHAEDSGQILAIDRWVLENCIRHLASTPAEVVVAVNLSTRSVSDLELPGLIRQRLKEAGVPAHRLHLEVTETSAMTNMDEGAEAVKRLCDIGCHVGLDDFGSGFTSLAYLQKLAASYVKIDGLLISALEHDHDKQVLLKAIVDIAHHSNRLVIAEWIESEAQMAIVDAYGIDLVQGFLLDLPKPMNADFS